jgi:hypothetical protein
MNRRQAIKAGIAAALAPVVAVGAVKADKVLVLHKGQQPGLTTIYPKELFGRSPGLEEIYIRQGLEGAWIKAHSKVWSEVLKKAI